MIEKTQCGFVLRCAVCNGKTTIDLDVLLPGGIGGLRSFLASRIIREGWLVDGLLRYFAERAAVREGWTCEGAVHRCFRHRP
ncbi:MAG: hypothetical protein L0H84_06445, partial [Pseudonocardia sp.]|nr:hypothetical protein [Pseudonocardia sp.]